LDLLPTLMGLCNIPAPSAAEFEGLDLSGLLRGTAKTPASRKLIIHAVQGNPPPPMWKSSCVLQDQWRLVEGTELYDIAHDPGQNENVARQHPQLVRSLREHYEQWYQQVSEHFDDDPPIVLGSDHENPTALTYDNLHHHARFYHDERAVREGVAVDGHWVVEVSQAGVYEISLRRWPAEAGLPLCASLAADTRRDGFLGTPSRFTAGKALPIAKARLRIADVDQTRKVAASGRAAIFRVHLPKGKTTLKAWFLDGKDQYLGAAYYAYVQRRSDRH
jgi:hypothetical protein